MGEVFYPERMAQRILGMGDILTLVEKASYAIKEEEAEALTKRMLDAKFDFEDFLNQYRLINNMGNMTQLLKMLPMTAQITERQIMEAEQKFLVFESLIQSMNSKERADPDLITKSKSRRYRIVRG